jgi:hypothetical protein
MRSFPFSFCNQLATWRDASYCRRHFRYYWGLCRHCHLRLRHIGIRPIQCRESERALRSRACPACDDPLLHGVRAHVLPRRRSDAHATAPRQEAEGMLESGWWSQSCPMTRPALSPISGAISVTPNGGGVGIPLASAAIHSTRGRGRPVQKV